MNWQAVVTMHIRDESRDGEKSSTDPTKARHHMCNNIQIFDGPIWKTAATCFEMTIVKFIFQYEIELNERVEEVAV